MLDRNFRPTQPRAWRSLVNVGLLAAAMLSGPAAAAANLRSDAARDDYRFDVYYNGKRIGKHEFRVDRSADEIQVESEANFTIKLLFVPVYKYRHVSTERWLAGCLQTLASSTNDNGELFKVALNPGPEQPILSKLAPHPTTTPLRETCPASYAYWDLELLRRGSLINSQTGDLMPARLVDHGIEQFDGIAARRFTLDVRETGTIQLWYRESDSQWIALETVRDGGTLAYRTRA
jgi:hypothetical protein